MAAKNASTGTNVLGMIATSPVSPAPASDSNSRAVNTSAAPFDATDRNAATSAAAPSNTSGHQKWNGTADSLNASPARMKTNPSNTIVSRAVMPTPPALI